jgi:hypothetical protein
VIISPGNDAPVVNVDAPPTFRGGDLIAMTASGTDAQDGDLSAALVWNVVLFHRDHDHPEGGPSTGPSRSFTATRDHEEESLYRVTVRARDSRGITTAKTVDIDPELINLRIDSQPQGVPIAIGGVARPTPFDRPSTINFITTVTAPEEHVVGARTYRFERWSDGGARSHDISIPPSDTTLTAVYRDTAAQARKRASRGGGPAGGMPFRMILPRAGLRIDTRHRIALKLRCARATGSCRLRTVLILRSRRARATRTLAAPRRVTVPAGTTATVRLKLTKAARQTLRRSRRLRALVRVTSDGRRLQRPVVIRPSAAWLATGVSLPLTGLSW